LNAALTEMIGEVEAGWENDIFFETHRKISPLYKAIL
jgi:hypothetical protein